MGADADTLDLLHRALQLTVTPVVVTAPPAPLVEVAVDEYDGATDKDGVFEVRGEVFGIILARTYVFASQTSNFGNSDVSLLRIHLHTIALRLASVRRGMARLFFASGTATRGSGLAERCTDRGRTSGLTGSCESRGRWLAFSSPFSLLTAFLQS